MATGRAGGGLDVAYADARGRVIVSDSLSYENSGVDGRDVLVGASFAGTPTVALALAAGVRGVVAHAAGPGKDGAGVSGLALAQAYGVPAAAVATMTARLSDGRSLLSGQISHWNEAAAALGVREGLDGLEAATMMLGAPESRPIDVGGRVDKRIHLLERRAAGEILGVWSLMLVRQPSPRAVFCIASHAARVMGEYAERVAPRAVIANDAGFGVDHSGVDGLPYLDRSGIPACAVSTDSARIGDPVSTWDDGILSAVNRTAGALGVREGMTAQAAARLLADAER